MDSLKISIIVPTYNGADRLPFLLECLLKQSVINFEVIVVVDGSTDNTLEILKSYESKFQQFRIITQSNKGRSAVRNRGALEAVGDILIFYDDDMVPFEDSIQRHITFHKEHRGILSGNQIEHQNDNKTDIQNYKAFLTKKWTQKYSNGITQLNLVNLFFTAANSSVPREIFNSLGGFDITLTDAEDYEFALRALYNGFSVFFDKDNRATHREFISCVGYIQRLRLYAEAHRKLERIHPGIYKKSKNRKTFVKRVIYRTLSMPWWPRLIEKKIFMVFPKGMRYKFYSIVIQALSIGHPEVKL